QLHGNESIELIRNIRKLNSKIRIIKAIPATRNLNNNIQKYKDEIDMFIIDTPSITYGGTGQTFDWKLLKKVKDVDFLIAGGLDFEKIKRLEKYSFGQRGYDISTGIESHNEKDFNKMTQILKFLKGDV
ncbi:MAG: phosphoribosylanthranilate isomerase, partial [Staphylococcus epidermidis]|nr:phosphoribosylanthranilate isomerase [Staphylococcus epidermidis]MDU3969908.1 phosphoribosylanthranilate isomerase [Staphylococcus epidermidis]